VLDQKAANFGGQFEVFGGAAAETTAPSSLRTQGTIRP